MLVKNTSGLIGDCLSGIPVTYALAKLEPKDKLYWWYSNEQVATLVKPLSNMVQISKEFADKLESDGHPTRILDVGDLFGPYSHTMHMTQAHFVMQGLGDPYGPVKPDLDLGNPIKLPQDIDYIISPYSRSNSADNNKFWGFEKWQAIIDHLADKKIYIVGTKEDHKFSQSTNVEYYFDQPLRNVCQLIANVKHKVLSIDNGISHLTYALSVPHVLIYPEILQPNWVDNPNALKVRGRPDNITVGQVNALIHA